MSAASLNYQIQEMLRGGFADIPDPGADGTIPFTNRGFGICEVVTATAEGRTLEDASNLAVGSELLVVLKTAGGDLTITFDAGTEAITTAGDVRRFVVVASGDDRVWAIDMAASSNVVTAAAPSAAAGTVAVSAGEDKSIEDATPADLSTVEIDTGDAGSDAAIVALFNALKGFGLVTGTWTAAD